MNKRLEHDARDIGHGKTSVLVPSSTRGKVITVDCCSIRHNGMIVDQVPPSAMTVLKRFVLQRRIVGHGNPAAPVVEISIQGDAVGLKSDRRQTQPTCPH